MRFDYLAFVLKKLLKLIAFISILPVITALCYREIASLWPFLYTGFGAIFINMLLTKAGRNIQNLNDLRKINCFGIVVTSWIITSIILSIPFLFFGISPIDAFFEGTSGITTTGATILTNYNYPHALLFWRALIQWLGGIGILVIFIAILPQFAVAGRQMFFAETPGPGEEMLTPRIRSTASAMYKIYLLLTIILILLLKITGMTWFESICTSMSTLACGGFVVDANLMTRCSSLTLWLITIFMIISGTNFNLLWRCFTKRNIKTLINNEEFKVYIYVFLLLSAAVSICGYLNTNNTFQDLIRDSAFSVISIMTSNGFAIDTYTSWSIGAQVFLFIAMFTGASASSTSGGIKIIRWVLVFKFLKTEITRIFHPNAVINVKSNNQIVPKEVIGQVLIFMFFYFLIFIFSAIIITLIEHNSEIGTLSALNAIGNIGFAPDRINSFTPLTKLILIFDMLIGRLEIIPFLVLLQPEFWEFRK